MRALFCDATSWRGEEGNSSEIYHFQRHKLFWAVGMRCDLALPRDDDGVFHLLARLAVDPRF